MSTSVSRRNFIKLATDTLWSLPVVAGGVLAMNPAQALAEDDSYEEDYTSEEDGGSFDNTSGGTTNDVQIIALKPSEVGFMVRDLGKKDNPAIPGAHVRIRSRYNGEVVEGETDKDGTLVLDITKLAEQPTVSNGKVSFACNATIEATCKGYRDFATGVMRVEGAQGHFVPTRSLLDEKPYPARVTLNDWDILYSTNLFTRGEDNDKMCRLRVILKNITDPSRIRVDLCTRKDKKLVEHATGRVQNGVLDVTFEREFLHIGSPDVLPKDTPLCMRFSTGGSTYEFPIAITLEDALFKKPVVLKDKLASPLGSQFTSGFKARFPANAPLGGKGTDLFTAWIPEFPINIYAEPTGYFQLTLKTPAWGYVNDNGKPADENGWKSFPRKSLSDQFKKETDDILKAADKTSSALTNRHGKITQISFSRQFQATANLQFVAAGRWDKNKNLFSGTAALQAALNMNLSLTESWLLGFVPMFVNFTIMATATLGTAIGFTTTPDKPKAGEDPDVLAAITDVSRYKWDFTNTGLTFTLFIWPSLSLGLGIKGLLSASLRGSCMITFFIGVTYRGELDPKTHPLPHLVLSMKFMADVVVEAFLFTHAWNLGTINLSDWYDNWKGGIKAESLDQVIAAEVSSMSMEDFLGQMTPVTDEMLMETREFGQVQAASAEGIIAAEAEGDDVEGAGIVASDGVAVWAEPVYREEYVEDAVFMEDGTPIPGMVFSWGPADEATIAEGSEEKKETESEQAADSGQSAETNPAQETENPAQKDASNDEEQTAPVADDDVLPLVEQGTDATSTLAGDVVPGEGGISVAVAAEAQTPEELQPTEEVSGESPETPVLATPADDASFAGEADETSAESDAESIEDAVDEGVDGVESTGEEDIESTEDAVQSEVVSAFVRPMPVYESLWDNDGWGVQAEAVGSGVAGLGKDGGIRPTDDMRLLSHDKQTYGNPRTQQIDFGDDESIVLRLGSVVVDGKPRTRLIATVVRSKMKPKGRSQVLDIAHPTKEDGTPAEYLIRDTTIKRSDLYDYEFAAIASHDVWDNDQGHHDVRRLHVALMCGKRDFQNAQDNKAMFASAASDLVYLYAVFEYNPQGSDPFMKSTAYAFSRQGKDLFHDQGTTFHSISNMQVNRAASGPGPNYIVMFLDRSGTTPLQTLGDNADVNIGIIYMEFIDNNMQAGFVRPVDPKALTKELGTKLDSTAYELDFWPMVPKDSGYFTLMVRGAKYSDYFTMKYTVNRLSPYELQTKVSFSHVHSGSSGVKAEADAPAGVDNTRMRMMAWRENNNQQQFLTSRDGKLMSAMVKDMGTPNATLTFEDVGPQSFGVSSFGVWGDFIYWPEGRRSDPGVTVDEGGNTKEVAADQVSRIMGARFRNGTFSDPFVMAEVDHFMDTIVSVSGTSTALTAVSAELTDGTKDAGMLWYTAIPYVRTITAIGAEAPNAFVLSGYKALFYVTLRNDGNTFLSGCEIAMFEGGLEVADATAKVTFTKDTLVESTHNPKNEKGEFLNVESDYAIAPGKSATHRVEILIPKDWSGNHKVSFIGRNPVVVSGGGVKAEAEDEHAVEYVVQPGEIPMDVITVETGEADLVTLDDAPVTVEKGKDRDKASSSANTRQGIPRTADVTSPVLAGGLAAAGAAVLAYERRRAQNEDGT